jgi:hypothetical protein
MSQILEEHPNLTAENIKKFKETCATDVAKEKAEKYKALQQRNMGNQRLGSCGCLGKRQIWDKEGAECEAVGLPDPLAKFTAPLEHDFIRAPCKWDKGKKVFYTDPVMRQLERILVIIHLAHLTFSF